MTRRGDLAHPLPLAALALLVVNDHVLKHVWPCWLTGKLSDFAGLFVFPVLLVTLVEVLCASRARRTVIAGMASALTAGAFTAAKMVPSLNAWLNRFASISFDASDVIAVAASAAAFLYLDAPSPRGVPRWQTSVVAALASLASVATSQPPAPQHPAWTLPSGSARRMGCAFVEAWISKSGQEGAGVTLAIDAPPGCEGRAGARLTAGAVVARSGEARFSGGGRRFLYLPMAFDNMALFEAGVTTGTLAITLDDGSVSQWDISAEQRALAAFGRPTGWHVVSEVDPPFVVAPCGTIFLHIDPETPRRLGVTAPVECVMGVRPIAAYSGDPAPPARAATREADGRASVELPPGTRSFDLDVKQNGEVTTTTVKLNDPSGARPPVMTP